MHGSISTILEFADGTARLGELRIGIGEIHCLFTVIHCSFANDGILHLLQEIDDEAVARKYPSFAGMISENSLLNSLFRGGPEGFERIPSVY